MMDTMLNQLETRHVRASGIFRDSKSFIPLKIVNLHLQAMCNVFKSGSLTRTVLLVDFVNEVSYPPLQPVHLEG